MIGGVHYRDDLRHPLLQQRLHSLTQCHVRHCAALATALETDVHDVVSDPDQADVPPVGSHAGINLLVEELGDSLTYRISGWVIIAGATGGDQLDFDVPADVVMHHRLDMRL